MRALPTIAGSHWLSRTGRLSLSQLLGVYPGRRAAWPAGAKLPQLAFHARVIPSILECTRDYLTFLGCSPSLSQTGGGQQWAEKHARWMHEQLQSRTPRKLLLDACDVMRLATAIKFPYIAYAAIFNELCEINEKQWMQLSYNPTFNEYWK